MALVSSNLRLGLWAAILLGSLLSARPSMASCGDYLSSNLGHSDIGLVRSMHNHAGSDFGRSSDNRDAKPKGLTKKRCFSCRGATIPLSTVYLGSDWRFDSACLHLSEYKESHRVKFAPVESLGDLLAGFYPAVLRPPIS